MWHLQCLPPPPSSDSSSSASVSLLLSSYVPISELVPVSQSALVHVSQSEPFSVYASHSPSLSSLLCRAWCRLQFLCVHLCFSWPNENQRFTESDPEPVFPIPLSNSVVSLSELNLCTLIHGWLFPRNLKKWLLFWEYITPFPGKTQFLTNTRLQIINLKVVYTVISNVYVVIVLFSLSLRYECMMLTWGYYCVQRQGRNVHCVQRFWSFETREHCSWTFCCKVRAISCTHLSACW